MRRIKFGQPFCSELEDEDEDEDEEALEVSPEDDASTLRKSSGVFKTFVRTVGAAVSNTSEFTISNANFHCNKICRVFRLKSCWISVLERLRGRGFGRGVWVTTRFFSKVSSLTRSLAAC